MASRLSGSWPVPDVGMYSGSEPCSMSAAVWAVIKPVDALDDARFDGPATVECRRGWRPPTCGRLVEPLLEQFVVLREVVRGS